MAEHTCANCQHHGDNFINIYMDWCNSEDSTYFNEMTNNDQYCEAWEPKAECGGCQYWDGDDGRCHNAASPRFMSETDDGCEKREDEE